MLIMSANLCCWGDGALALEKRMPRMAAVLQKYAPDFICVQECTEAWYAYLTQAMGTYASISLGRDPDGTGEASGIFYKKESYTAADSGTFWLSETPEKCSFGWDADCRRVCTHGVFTDAATGSRFTVYNTHLDHLGVVAQQKGAELIVRCMADVALPAVLTGDFNVTEDSAAYSAVSAALRDARYAAAETDLCGTWHNYGELDDMTAEKPIDHVFVSKGWNVRAYKIIRDKVDNQFISDHYPVLIELD